MSAGKYSNKGVSIVICCYNSKNRIIETLNHLHSQTHSGEFPLELIIVDNNSNDDTVELIKEFWKSRNSSINLIITYENKQGLAYARIKGISCAKYDYIIFCDDDNWLPAEYTSTVYNFFESHADFGLLGASCKAVSSIPLPEWFHEFRNAYACGQQYYHSGDVTGLAFLWGAGLAARRHLLESVYDKSHPVLFTGRKGKELISGDDDEINGRVWLMGFRSWYNEELVIEHYIDPSRLNKEYPEKIIGNFKGQGYLRGAYYRLYLISRMNRTERVFKSVSYFLKLLTSTALNNKAQRRIATSFLYFLTGISFLADTYGHSAYHFYRSISKQHAN